MRYGIIIVSGIQTFTSMFLCRLLFWCKPPKLLTLYTSIYYNSQPQSRCLSKLQLQLNPIVGNPMTGINTTDLAAEWLNPSTKQFLKQRIRSMAKDNEEIISTNDTAIAEEYYRMWLQAPMSNPMQRLVRHPLITTQDKKKIDSYVFQQQKSQIMTGAGITVGVLAIYRLFLSKTSFFQNFFNNRERKPIFNVGRKVLGVYAVFLAAMATMNSHYQKKIPNGLNDMGMFKKYRISYQQKYV